MSQINLVRTLRSLDHPNLLWVELETNEGLVGLGETFRGAEAVEAVIHHQIAPWLMQQDSRRIESISSTLTTPYLGFGSASAEIRAASAIDIALWDLKGLRHGVPVHEALGGAVRTTIAAYNTCAGYSFNTGSSTYNAGASRRVIDPKESLQGPYDDQVAFVKDAGALAKSLVSEGYRAMKIWPFDVYAQKTQGQFISQVDIEAGLEPFKLIREAVGNRIEVMCELHSLWNFDAAVRICQALEPYNIFWAEDPLCKMNDAKALAELRTKTRVPICGSETLAGTVAFRDHLAAGALDIVMIDLAWCGGLSEGRKIAALAGAYARPLAPHDCSGPIVLWAGLQLVMHATSGFFQEVVRATMSTWYRDAVTALPIIRDGLVQLPTQPGIGACLAPAFRNSSSIVQRESRR